MKKENLETITYVYEGENCVEQKRRTADGVYYSFLSHTQSRHGSGKMASSHLHFVIELLYCLSGDGIVQIGKEKYDFSKGSLVVIPSGAVHQVFATSNGVTKYIVVQFEPDIVRASELFALEEGVTRPFFGISAGECGVFTADELRGSGIPAKMKNIAHEYDEKKAGFAFAVRTEICGICVWLMRHRKDTLQEDKTEKCFKVLFDYVEQKYSGEVTSKEAARLCGMSYSYFSRYFKNVTGESFKRYLCAVRVEKAERLLAETDRSVTEIALDVGFSSTSYFISCFRKYKKSTPSEFRRNCQVK